MADQFVLPTAEPFFFPGNEVGCLLVHGFTGTPKEMRWMGEFLANKGYTVMGIRLAGHATSMANMMRTCWQDWLSSVEDGYHMLRPVTKYCFIIGLSMGGVLSLTAAARYAFDGVIAMSTPYALPQDWRLRYLRMLARIQPDISKGPPDWRDLQAASEHISYPRYPTVSLAELNELLELMRNSLPEIKIPVLLMHSRKDGGVPPDSMEKIEHSLTVEKKQMLWLENSGHVITREPDREVVFEAAAAFIESISNLVHHPREASQNAG